MVTAKFMTYYEKRMYSIVENARKENKERKRQKERNGILKQGNEIYCSATVLTAFKQEPVE